MMYICMYMYAYIHSFAYCTESVALTSNNNSVVHVPSVHIKGAKALLVPSPPPPPPPPPPSQLASGHLAHSHYDDTDVGPATKKRKVASSRIERPKGVAPQFRQTDTSDVQEVKLHVYLNNIIMYVVMHQLNFHLYIVCMYSLVPRLSLLCN